MEKLKKLVECFEYEQHAQNKIIETLDDYPSLQKGLEKAKEKGITRIEVGGAIPFSTKPILAPDPQNKKIILHING